MKKLLASSRSPGRIIFDLELQILEGNEPPFGDIEPLADVDMFTVKDYCQFARLSKPFAINLGELWFGKGKGDSSRQKARRITKTVGKVMNHRKNYCPTELASWFRSPAYLKMPEKPRTKSRHDSTTCGKCLSAQTSEFDTTSKDSRSPTPSRRFGEPISNSDAESQPQGKTWKCKTFVAHFCFRGRFDTGPFHWKIAGDLVPNTPNTITNIGHASQKYGHEIAVPRYEHDHH